MKDILIIIGKRILCAVVIGLTVMDLVDKIHGYITSKPSSGLCDRGGAGWCAHNDFTASVPNEACGGASE